MCDTPFMVNRNCDGVQVPVPCGRCPPCKLRRTNDWVFRLLEEDKVSASRYFVTLTYDYAHVPMSPNGFRTLRKKDFQDYMKRLRKLCGDTKLKYYACGEYGTENARPHFHMIIFNVPNAQYIIDAWSLDGVQFGKVQVDPDVNTNNIAYVLKYMHKVNGKIWKGYRDDREPEFPLMSKGLGASYIENPQVVKYHKADLSRMFVVKEGGWKVALPRYYRLRIYSESERLEQTSIAQESTYERDIKDRKVWYNLYKNTDFTFDDWKASSVRGRALSFNSQIKSRNVED